MLTEEFKKMKNSRNKTKPHLECNLPLSLRYVAMKHLAILLEG